MTLAERSDRGRPQRQEMLGRLEMSVDQAASRRAFIGFLAAIPLLAGTDLAATAAEPPSGLPDRLQTILSRGTIRVGTTFDTPVFSMKDSAGTPSGFDMDALASLAKALGVKVEYVKISFGSMLADLAADKFDIVMSGVARTPERARSVAFSRPYLRIGKLIMVRTTDKDRFRSMSDVDQQGVRVTYNMGGLNDRFVNTRFAKATPTGFESNEIATSKLLAGAVEAQVSDSTAAVYMARQNPKLSVIDAQHPMDPIYVAVLLNKQDQTLLNFVNLWLDQLELDGTLKAITTKWLGEDFR